MFKRLSSTTYLIIPKKAQVSVVYSSIIHKDKASQGINTTDENVWSVWFSPSALVPSPNSTFKKNFKKGKKFQKELILITIQ